MQLLKILLIFSHLLTFSSSASSFGTLRGSNEHTTASKDEAADDDDDDKLSRPPKEAVMIAGGGGGGFKIRSALANNTEVGDNITQGKWPYPVNPGYIFVPDDRYPFTDSRFPFSTVGLVLSTINATHSSRCTGTMVGPRHMLTASHCLNFGSDGFKSTTFTPAYDDGDAPYGTFEGVKVYYLVLPDKDGDGMLSDHDSAFDYAVFVLDGYPQTGGYMGAKIYDSAWNDIPLWTNIGYPTDHILNGGDPNPVFSTNGTVHHRHTHYVNASGAGEIDGYSLWTEIDINKGQSGGPVYGHWEGEGDDGGYYVIGVVSSSSPLGNRVGGGPGLLFLINSALADYP